MKNKNLYYILGGVLVIGIVALVAMQLRGSSSLQGYLALPGMPPRSTVGTAKPNTPNPVAADSSPNVVADLRKPPVVYIITNPLPSGQAQPGDKFTVATLIDQGDLDLNYVEVYVNEKIVITQDLPHVQKFTYTYVVDLTALADGTYSLGVKAYDKVGHNAEKKIAFTVKHPVAPPATPPHLDVTSPKIGLIYPDVNKEIIFNLILDTSGISSIKYYVDADKNNNPVLIKMISYPSDPKLFNWVLPVFAWANHDGIFTWHIYPYAFIKDAASGKYVSNSKFNETPELLECSPDPEVSCTHKIRLEGTVNGGPAKIVKEITVVVTNENFNYGPDAVKNNYIRVDVQSIKDIK